RSANASLTAGSAANDQSGYNGVLVKQGRGVGRESSAIKSFLLADALLRGGIEYIEVRSLDINPFSPIGVDEQQVRFLDLFMVWCV
ncbi:hypothetical protein MJM43_28695, partial [Salmonella enterica subsp. enterica serovar Montevideo]|nr:hypothetical protein [Salmonella enterica subsp. enterica serovar Montevideo]